MCACKAACVLSTTNYCYLKSLVKTSSKSIKSVLALFEKFEINLSFTKIFKILAKIKNYNQNSNKNVLLSNSLTPFSFSFYWPNNKPLCRF